ncbi:MAG: GNAT family N-acetyltransferase [Candidatus Melainabacteria bacterium]|jgi:hypothetical protein
MQITLFDNYFIQSANDFQEFDDFIAKNKSIVFSDTIDTNLSILLTNKEKISRSELAKNAGTPYKLRLYILKNSEIVGWFYGEQKDSETFQMIQTAIFQEHQNKGIYKALLPIILEILKEKGFQKVFSRHKATNNQVIIPKLRQGFMITAFEVIDIFGVLIHLTYYFNENRQKLINYRVGQLKPDALLKEALSLNEWN